MSWWHDHEKGVFGGLQWTARLLTGAGLAVVSRLAQKWLVKRAEQSLIEKQLLTSMDGRRVTLRGTIEESARQLQDNVENMHALEEQVRLNGEQVKINEALGEKYEEHTKERFTELREDMGSFKKEVKDDIRALRQGQLDMLEEIRSISQYKGRNAKR